jgi:adenylate kinase family enzyme
MPRADTILWLDLPRRVAFPRVIRRMARHFGRARDDMAPGYPERLDLAFLKWAWTFKREHAAKYHLALAAHASHASVKVYTRPREVNCFLASSNL